MEKCSAETLAGTRCTKNATTEGKCTQHHKIATRVVVMCGHRWSYDPDKRCKNKANHGLFCGVHKELTPEQKCTHIRGEVQCDKKKQVGQTFCPRHYRREQERLFAVFREANRHVFTTIYMNRAHQNNIDPFGGDQQYAIRMMDCVIRCLHFKFHRAATDTRTDEEIVDMFPVILTIRPPDTRTELQRLAQDTQNVHTALVSEQTNKGIENLMKIPIPENQNTMTEIRRKWTQIYIIRAVDERIYTDMNNWYTQPSCCKMNDWLYKNVLDHLWAKIKAEPKKDVQRELIKRLQQECAESYQMCCVGHINRLINVLVGFDEEFKPQISKGEILQNKFSEFANIADDTDKYVQATALLAELGVVGDEAAVWLDALAV